MRRIELLLLAMLLSRGAFALQECPADWQTKTAYLKLANCGDVRGAEFDTFTVELNGQSVLAERQKGGNEWRVQTTNAFCIDRTPLARAHLPNGCAARDTKAERTYVVKSPVASYTVQCSPAWSLRIVTDEKRERPPEAPQFGYRVVPDARMGCDRPLDGEETTPYAMSLPECDAIVVTVKSGKRVLSAKVKRDVLKQRNDDAPFGLFFTPSAGQNASGGNTEANDDYDRQKANDVRIRFKGPNAPQEKRQ